MVGSVATHAADTSTNPPAKVSISGFGFFGNRELLRLLQNFQPDGKLPAVIPRNFVEDAALVLFSRAKTGGYLEARLEAKFTLPDGSHEKEVWTNALAVSLPRDFAATEASFRLRSGVRFYYDAIEFTGLTAIPEREARNFFVSGDTLVRLHSNRIFNPDQLKSSLANLTETLRRKGYRSAVVRASQVEMDEASGAVAVQIAVEEGLPTVVRSVAVTVAGGDLDSTTNHWRLHPDKPYSILWEQNLARRLREQQYARGYPDATVTFHVLEAGTNANNIIELDLAAAVTNGPLIHVAAVKFRGNRLTRLSAIKSRVNLAEGDLLDRNTAEQSRQQLARLGVFSSVHLEYEDVTATNRNVIYELKESKPISWSVLAGYGSYELLRGGLEFENNNVLGLAHNLRLRGVQSFKSTSLDGQYTVPEIGGGDISAFLSGSGLRREEVTFTRKESGGSVGLQKYFDPIQTDVSAHYDYQFLDATGLGSTRTNEVGVTYARSAAFVFDFNRDRRDTPVLPHSGSRIIGRVEFAAADLGGDVNYQRFLFGGSYHLDLHGGRLLHLGVLQGYTSTLGGNAEELPFTKRYFPGGANSVRGYQEGEASPLDSKGKQLGAETYTQGNVELEQLITKSWSVVGFFDAVGFAKDRADYPCDEGLYSVGGGLSWRSLIGPVRLEYGYNLHRREHDPVGTLHFSVGFPF